MFLNTRAAFDKLLCDIKSFCYGVGIALNSAYILSMVYAIVVGRGFLPLNIVFLAVAVAYFVYYIFTYWDENKCQQKKTVKSIHRAVKFFSSTVTLSIAIYSIYLGSQQITFISLLLVVTSVLCWIFNAVSTIFIMFLESRKELILNAFLMDMKPVTTPVNAVNSFVKRIKGEEEPEELFGVSEKAKSKIDNLRTRFVEKKKKQKEDKKRAKEQKEIVYK